nr:cytochrome P450 71A2-like [Tanacetum cinerariifolium]
MTEIAPTSDATIGSVSAIGTLARTTRITGILHKIEIIGSQKLQDEVNLVAQGRPKITKKDIGKLKYLHAVLKETMRLHAPATLVIRASFQGVKVMGYDITAKTRVFVNLWALGQDPTIWEEHQEFKPERFINSHFDYKANHYGFIPFGGGRRGCPGISIANTLMELILANVVYKFDFALANGERAETLDMSETSSLTISRKNHLLLVALLVINSSHRVITLLLGLSSCLLLLYYIVL